MSALALLLVSQLTLGAAPGIAAAPQDVNEVIEAVGIDQRLDAELPLEAEFVDEEGRFVRLGDSFGERPVILAFVYYECPRLCNMILNGLVRALKPLGLEPGSDFEVVAISIDPGESPVLAARAKGLYLDRYDRPETAEGWHFLTGSPESIAAATRAAGYRFRYDETTDQYAHGSGVMVVTPEGRLSRYFYGVEYSPKDLRLGLVEAGDGRIGSLVDQVLLLCFHYDPATGRYGFAIQSALRITGVLTVALLLGFVVRSRIRERRQERLAARSAGAPPLGRTGGAIR